MHNIAVLAGQSPQKFQVEKALKENANFLIKPFIHASDLLPPIRAGEISGIVILTKQFCRQHIELLSSLTKKLRQCPLILTSTYINQSLRVEYIKQKQDTSLVLDLRYELPHLNPMLEKVIHNKGLPNRAYCRYFVNNHGFLNDLGSGNIERIRVVDLSYGGARVKTKPNAQVTSPLISLTIDGTKEKSYNIIGRIVWRDDKSRQLGIQFQRHFAIQNN